MVSLRVSHVTGRMKALTQNPMKEGQSLMSNLGKVNQKSSSVTSVSSLEILTKPLVPNGLGSVINNCQDELKSLTGFKFGQFDEKDIQEKFDAMKSKVTGTGTVFKDAVTGELLELKSRSRWNGDYNYPGSVKRKILNQVESLRKVTLVTLTYDMKLVRQLIPDWWVLDEKAFIILHNDRFVTSFLRKLRHERQKVGLKWNYVASACEFHDGKRDVREKLSMQELSVSNKGILHNHLIFYGGWVAGLSTLLQCWGLCQLHGIDVKVRQGVNAARYISKYVGKTLTGFQDDPELARLAKWFWHFRRRMFNTRHKKNGRLGIPGEEIGVKKKYEIAGYFFKDVRRLYEDESTYDQQKRQERREYEQWLRETKKYI